MQPSRPLVACLCALAVAATALLTAVRGSATETAAQSRLVEQEARMPAVGGTLRYAVYLPFGYDTDPTRRYPVLYALHGLPGDSSSYRSLEFLRPVLDGMRAQAIVVFPQGANDGDSDDEYLDLGPGRDWETALTRQLPGRVGAHFRTLRGRAATGILGVSAGGYGAALLGLHHLDRYAVVESWSGYFHATTPDGSAPMTLPEATAAHADMHRLVAAVARQVRHERTLIGFFTGASDPYPGFVDENRQFDEELTAAKVPHRFAVYRGGHDTTLWTAHARDWLGQALRALAPAR